MNFAANDIHQLGAILAQAARDEIMPRFGRLTSGQIRQKTSAADLVTEMTLVKHHFAAGVKAQAGIEF